jgi:hypothetical protein
MRQLSIKRLRVLAVICGLGVLGALAGVAIASAGGAGKRDTGTAYIGLTSRSTKTLLYPAGFITDKVLGNGAVTYTLKPLAGTAPSTVKVKALKVTTWTTTGSLSGTGSATLTITNKPKAGDATVSAGKLNLTHGTGGQTGHSLVGTFTGNGNVSSGQYVFHYKATYK